MTVAQSCDHMNLHVILQSEIWNFVRFFCFFFCIINKSITLKSAILAKFTSSEKTEDKL